MREIDESEKPQYFVAMETDSRAVFFARQGDYQEALIYVNKLSEMKASDFIVPNHQKLELYKMCNMGFPTKIDFGNLNTPGIICLLIYLLHTQAHKTLFPTG